MKKKEIMKRIISLTLTGVLCAGMIQVPVSAETNTENATVSVYPAPQSVAADSEEGMMLEGTVDVVVHGEQDVATLPKLKALLTEEGITYAEKTAVGANAAIVLAAACDDADCDICNSVADAANALSEGQGYVLKSSNDANEKGQITIVGADADGTYYGVMTLLQMFKQKTSDGRIAEVTISDYPDVEFRGYVEGFYGFPWSFNDRKELFEDTSLYKMNTYIYAPKDDPYHRDSWRTLYPAEEAANLTELAQIATENNMEFCWTIHPGADYSYSSDADYNKLIAKLEQVYSFGVRQFGIFYDDLSYGVANGTRHATVINNAYKYLQDKYGDVKPFITVLTRYTNSWGADMYSYFRPFMQLINEDTIVLWTGNSTMSAITYDYFQWPQNQTGIDRDFGVWWNYPVNDYCDGHLLMSPLHCLDNDVTNICSFFLNPMSEADASKVAIYSGADYSWNMGDFDSQTSWERAIYELVPEANKAFERFADNIGYVNEGSGFIFNESVYLEEDLNKFERALSSGTGLEEAIQTLKAKFEEIIADADALKLINDAELLEEITVHLDAYKVLGQAGVAVMEAYEAALAGEIQDCIDKTAVASELLQDSTEYKVPVFNDGRVTEVRAYVGSHRLLPFLESVVDDATDILNENLIVPRYAKVLTNVEELEAEVITSGDDYSVENISATMNEGDYIAIALPKAVCIEEINAAVAPAENFKVQYSLNGIEWFDATDALVMGTYVRVLCTVDNTEAVITELSTSTKETADALTGTVSTNMGTYQTYRISNALDGNMNTKYYSSEGASAGDYIQVDFGGKAVIENTVIYFGGSPNSDATAVDGFFSTKLQASTDGTTWIDVCDAVEYTSYTHIGNGRYAAAFSIDGGVQAQYLRFTADKSGDNWVQVYEIEFNDVSIVGGTVSLGQGSYLDDGDLGTAPMVSNIKEGDTIIYPMTTITNVETLGIYQEKISKAAVSVQKLDGTWEDIGTLDVTWNVFDINETILAVKLTFDGTVIPVINEIVVTEIGAVPAPKPDPSQRPAELPVDTYVNVTTGNYEVDGGTEEGPAGLATDNNVNTKWHTEWHPESGNSYDDHWLQIELDKVYSVSGFKYLPRQDSSTNGDITKYQILVSVDGENWEVAADGSWNEGKSWKDVSFKAKDAKYVRLQAVETMGDQANKHFTSAAEVRVIGLAITDTPNPPVEVPEEVCKVFPDVEHDAWYEEAVQFVYDNGIMSGSDGLFNPTGNITRAQVVATLYKLEGSPEVTDFKAVDELVDVEADQWYTNAVCWAYNTSVATGNQTTKMFNMGNPVTRQQLASFFYSYAEYKGLDTETSTDISGMAGADQVADYALETMQWAVGTGLITGSKTIVNGVEVSDLKPTGTASRAQVAAIIMRFCEN